VRPIAVIGNLSVDRIDGGAPQPGGGPFHAARALRALNRPSLIAAGAAAPDRALLLPALARLGIPVLWRETATTARFSIEYDGEERRLVAEELGEPWRPRDVAGWKTLAPVRWVHAAPLSRADFPADTLAALIRGGRRVSFDGQGLVRPGRTGPIELDAAFDPDVLAHVSILKLSDEEARALVGEPSEEALRSLGVPEVVVTLGSRGSIVLADGLAEHIPTRALTDAEPTGAGDAFAAGYLVARASGLGPPAAARLASGLVAGLLAGSIR
jgi:sugar/nucleoside kinase (ribokinase family)